MNQEIEKHTVALIQHDFNLEDFSQDTLENIRQLLIERLDYLLDHDFARLLDILYRIDVNEEKVKNMLAKQAGTNSSEILADLIIERQIEKAKTRIKFRRDPPTF